LRYREEKEAGTGLISKGGEVEGESLSFGKRGSGSSGKKGGNPMLSIGTRYQHALVKKVGGRRRSGLGMTIQSTSLKGNEKTMDADVRQLEKKGQGHELMTREDSKSRCLEREEKEVRRARRKWKAFERPLNK